MKPLRARHALRAIGAWILAASMSHADVEAITIEVREPYFAGSSIPGIGPYERIVATVDYVFDPADPNDAKVVDLELAPRDEDGRVRAQGDLVVLQPVDPAVRAGTGFLEVVNRGRFASLAYFQGAPARDPRVEGDIGDGWLLRQGLTLLWVGWQFDVPRDERRLELRVPRVLGNVRGLVRSDWVVDEATNTLDLAHRDHVAYPVVDPRSERNVLTLRRGRNGERRVVPRGEWRFAREVDGDVAEDRTHIFSSRGFEPGHIYELVYEAEQPAVVGLGLAAVRDVMAYAKHDADCPFPVERGVAFGVSQTGRFLRHFLYEGFNVDGEGRLVFDGMLIHSAGGGRGSFNHRFGQPSRDAHRYSAFSYPTDLFPFSGRAQRDPLLGRREGLLSAPEQLGRLPKIAYTNTGYEYWGRAGSLLHTSLDGSADVAPLANERIYHLSSGQHFVASFPPRDGDRRTPRAGLPGYRGNPLDFRLALRAIADALFAWVKDDVAPPASAYPRIDRGTLVPVHELGFPQIPGWPAPRVVHEVRRRDYGERWNDGIIDQTPPLESAAYATLVPAVDRLGNERGGWPMPELLVPLATYTPWRLRTDFAHETDELEDFWGNWIPLSRTEEERKERGDPRPSVETLYSSEEAFLEAVQFEARKLIDRRHLLAEDLQAVLRRAASTWRLLHGS